MFIRVLGSAAGGGFPQWNCGCPNCRGLATGTVRASARTQESVAVSADGASWFLLNASPEIRQQIEGFPGLHPRAPRDSPIAGILLTNGDLDHCLGLLSLRESHPLVVYATEPVRRRVLEGNVLYRTLERFPGQVTWRTSSSAATSSSWDPTGGRPVSPSRRWRCRASCRCTSRARAAVAGGQRRPAHPRAGDRTGARLLLGGGRRSTDDMRRVLDGADVLFFDGTFWSSDELPALGLGTRAPRTWRTCRSAAPAAASRAWPASAPGGASTSTSTTRTRCCGTTRPSGAQVDAAGWEVAARRDGGRL